ARSEPVPVSSGAVVFHEGDAGDAFYLVARGAFGVYAPGRDGTGDTRLASLGPGAPFGEMALLTNRPRSATIRAETAGDVLRLERRPLPDLGRRQPRAPLAIPRTLGR